MSHRVTSTDHVPSVLPLAGGIIRRSRPRHDHAPSRCACVPPEERVAGDAVCAEEVGVRGGGEDGGFDGGGRGL